MESVLGMSRHRRPREPGQDPRPGTQERLLVRAAVHQCAMDEALVLDAGFGLSLLQEEGATRYVVRCAKNSVFRRATPVLAVLLGSADVAEKCSV